jgi:hypothetical protein
MPGLDVVQQQLQVLKCTTMKQSILVKALLLKTLGVSQQKIWTIFQRVHRPNLFESFTIFLNLCFDMTLKMQMALHNITRY